MTGRWNDDPVTRVERGLVEKGVMKPRPTRAQKREREPRPEGATKPFLHEERVPKRRAAARRARKARKAGRGKR